MGNFVYTRLQNFRNILKAFLFKKQNVITIMENVLAIFNVISLYLNLPFF